MDRSVDFLIIGGGVAAASCAATLREAGAEGTILVAGRELDPPYHRPPLSKDLLQGRATKEDALVREPGFWEAQGIELLTRANVMALDPQARTAKVGKEEVGFGKALVATGAMVRRLPVDGSDLDGIHYLRAPGNAKAIAEDVAEVEEVVLVGGSYIGCEVAASLTVLGKRCTIVMQEDEPLERGFGRVAGARVRALLEGKGITVLGGAEVARFTGEGRVAAVELADGRSVPAGAVVCGVGATPDVMLARKSGLPIGDAGGVRCDSTLQVEGHEGIYAAGDMCEWDSVLHGGHVRIEHEDVATQQGAHVARAMLGGAEAYAVVPYFWSDLADWATLEYVSVGGTPDDEELVEDGGGWGVRYTQDGRLVAALSVAGGLDLDAARAELGGQHSAQSL
jgi:3-phenylpropionate/trans-cinnamate dioxygenase ferredoxin reductase component